MEDGFRIGIIGGAGKMGNLFKNLFQKKGYEVLISDINQGISKEELFKKCKLIIISVPMDVFQDVVFEIAKFVEPHHWIMDVCSLKYEPAKYMKKNFLKGEILATHPLFGPFEKNLKGKIIAYYPLRGKKFMKWFVKTMEEEGLKLVKISPKKHDEIMGLVQVLNHFWLILLGKVIKDCGFKIEEVFSLATPSFLRQLNILRRLAWQDASLYAKIQLENPLGKKFRKLLCRNCQSLSQALNFDKTEEREKVFKEFFLNAKEIAKKLNELFTLDPDFDIEEESNTE